MKWRYKLLASPKSFYGVVGTQWTLNPPPQVRSLLEASPALAQLEEQLTVVSYILNQSHQRVTRSNRVGWTIHSSSSGLGQSAVNWLTRVRIPVSELCIYGQVVRRLFSKEKIVRSNRTRCILFIFLQLLFPSCKKIFISLAM